MEFFHKRFPGPSTTLYPLGDFHFGSAQCNERFIRQVIDEIKVNDKACWVGMGDLIENAVVGSKSDVYTQTVPPKDQMDYICDLLQPIAKKGLFLIAGNHEQRTMRLAGIIPEQYMAVKLGLPYMGFSAFAYLIMTKCHTPRCFQSFFHHNYGGGWTPGGKVNRAEALRKIVPTADATFSAHFHTTSRTPVTWYECGRHQIIKHTGYDYITGSALEWGKSYAEERAKPSATVEFIKVTFIGSVNGRTPDGRRQVFEVIQPNGG